MAIGSRYWASSFIILKSGKKMYLSNHIDDIKEQMRKKKANIEVATSNLYSKTFILKKTNIESYGTC